MRCLTIQQPWAWAVFHGKCIENRTQLWSYRGPLAIHAGQRFSDRGGADERVIGAFTVDQRRNTVRRERSAPCRGGIRLQRSDFGDNYGVILGVVDLVDVHPDAGNCCRPWGESAYVEHGGRNRRDVAHLVFEDPRELADPIPCQGALGLWTPPSDIVEKLREIAAMTTCLGALDE